MKKVLIASYGGAHSQALIPIIEYLKNDESWDVQVLGLTYAFRDFYEAALTGIWDFDSILRAASPRYEKLLTVGEKILPEGFDPAVGYENSRAYYGSGFADLIDKEGLKKGAAKFLDLGRKSFFPIQTAEEILSFVSPDIVVTTNSPRMERAMAIAARNLNLPVVIVVPTFLSFELEWVGDNEYGTHVCVFHDAVKRVLTNFGRNENAISVTGNPYYHRFVNQALERCDAFDLNSSVLKVLYLAQQEIHPMGSEADKSEPNKLCVDVLAELRSLEEKGVCEASVRFHPKQASSMAGIEVPINVIPNDIPLADVAFEFDMVISVNSSAAIECQLLGLPVIELMWSIKAGTVPFGEIGPHLQLYSLKALGAAIENFGSRDKIASAYIPKKDPVTKIVGIMKACMVKSGGD